jgi:hypothetical protein
MKTQQKEAIYMLYETGQTKRRVSVNLTGIQNQELKAMSETLGISLSLLLSLLVRYFIYGTLNGILTLNTLLKEYQKLQRDRNNKKACKANFSITEREFQELNDLANQGFYLPGELAGILAELLLAGIIDTDSIWNISPIRRPMPQNS